MSKVSSEMPRRALIVYARGDLVINAYFAARLRKSVAETGLSPFVVTSQSLLATSQNQLKELKELSAIVIFRSRNVSLSKGLEEIGFKVVNRSSLLEVATDKLKTFEFCHNHGIPTVQTVPLDASIVAELLSTQPVVIKDRFGHGGSSVSLLKNENDAYAYLSNASAADFVVQPFIDDVLYEWRAYVIGINVAYWVRKTPRTGEFRANLSQGAKITVATPPNAVSVVVNKAVSHLGEGVYGIDVLDTTQGALLGEIEDPVGYRSLYQLHCLDPTKPLANYYLSVSNRN